MPDPLKNFGLVTTPPRLFVDQELALEDPGLWFFTSPPGCHSTCKVGAALNRSCDACVQEICREGHDPFCCDGGFLSFYSTEPIWDAKCVSEVNTYCGGITSCPPATPAGPTDYKFVRVSLKAGVHYRMFLSATVRSPNLVMPTDSPVNMQLLWESAGMPKQVVPMFALYPGGQPVAATGKGSGLNVTYFGTKVDQAAGGMIVPDFSVPLAAGSSASIGASPAVGPLGTPLVDLFPPTVAPGDPNQPALPLPKITSPLYGGEVAAAITPDGGPTALTVRGTGVAGSSITVTVDGRFLNLSDAERTGLQSALPHAVAHVAADGTFSATLDVPSISGTWLWVLRQKDGPNPPRAARAEPRVVVAVRSHDEHAHSPAPSRSTPRAI